MWRADGREEPNAKGGAARAEQLERQTGGHRYGGQSWQLMRTMSVTQLVMLRRPEASFESSKKRSGEAPERGVMTLEA